MIFIKSFLISLLIAEGILCTVTDMRQGKIPNKAILIGVVCSVVGNILYYLFSKEALLRDYLVNLLATAIVSFVMYWFHIWAAGDVKFFILLFSLIPSEFYYNKAPLPVVAMFVALFSCAFIYVCFEGIIFMLKHEKVVAKGNARFSFVGILLCTAFIISCHSIFQLIFSKLYIAYLPVFLFLNIILILVYNTFNLQKNKAIMWGCILISIFSVITSIIDKEYKFELHSVVCTCIVVLFRYIADQFNYKEIPTCDVKEGMVLSYATVILMSNSRVKGLPQSTTEDMASRLTKDEAESIRRWESSKYGKKQIVILRKLPFACFIFLGVFIYLVWGVTLW